ncbi:SURF1 family protein [Asticcacaulis solisilvae]|uniref:SURF1 family protein n=1 Tax=Asticcacaulis solisilvae TaxID=1217274 RepID=UPI003FD6C745
MRMGDYFKAAPGLLISALIAFILLNGLGIWQLCRLQWKEQLIADMARTEAMPPLPAAALLAEAKPQWRSAVLPTCQADLGRALYMHSEVDGVPGYRALVACPTGAGSDMLVDLGFTKEKKPAQSVFGFVPVGRLRPADKPSVFAPVNNPAANDWYTRSTLEMGKALGYALRPDYFLVLDLKASHLDDAGLQQGPLTAPLTNRHLEYALTWFSMAWIMAGIVFVMVRQRMAPKINA